MTWAIWVNGVRRSDVEAEDFATAQIWVRVKYPDAVFTEVYRAKFPKVLAPARPALVKAG